MFKDTLLMDLDVELVGLLVLKERVHAADGGGSLWLLQGGSSSAGAWSAGSHKVKRIEARVAELSQLVTEADLTTYQPDNYLFLGRLVRYCHFQVSPRQGPLRCS